MMTLQRVACPNPQFKGEINIFFRCSIAIKQRISKVRLFSQGQKKERMLFNILFNQLTNTINKL
jgi:hypothetical protein